MKFLSYSLLFLMASIFFGCGPSIITTEPEPVFMIGDSVVDSLRLSRTIDSISDTGDKSYAIDRTVAKYYKENQWLLWLDDEGLAQDVDTLIHFLSNSDETGIRKELFFVDEIKDDLHCLRTLNFANQDMYTVVSRLDFNLTRAFVRYVAWQRYGLVKPGTILNAHTKDPHHDWYRTLYDIPTDKIDEKGYLHLTELAGTDSVLTLVSSAEPASPLYKRLKTMLKSAEGDERTRILVNMERCRWRHPSEPTDFKKYVVVNIPSYMLYAVSEDSILDMKVVCGASSTKTPLVHSNIMRIDVNPRWMMPPSVVKHEMARHAGDVDYFARHRYHIIDSSTGAAKDVSSVTQEMLETYKCRIYQEGGNGNALGRIIFRFNNNFSIYLHDTPTRGTFARDDRRASHGCVRLEKPFDLACFLMEDKDEKLLDKLRYSIEYMGPLEGNNDPESGDKGPDRKRLIHNISVKPEVPLFITYYTMYITPDGTLHTYPDVYEFDKALAPKITKYYKKQ